MGSLIGSVNNLIGTVGSQAVKVGAIAKGILCLPSLLKNAPALLGGLASTVMASVAQSLTQIIAGFTGVISQIVLNTLNILTSSVRDTLNNILSIQAQIIAAISAVIGLIRGLAALANDIKKFSDNEENCKFAEAELMKCIASAIFNEMSTQLTSGNASNFNVNNYIAEFTSKLGQPNEAIDKFVTKQSQSVDKANTQVAAIKIF